MENRPALHLTLKWPALAGRPETMINVYAETVEDLEQLANDAARCVVAALGIGAEDAAPVAIAAPAKPAPVAARRRTTNHPSAGLPLDYLAQCEEAEICPNETCSNHREPMAESKFGGLYCPGRDPEEEAGYCRWVIDRDGIRRKPTKPESDASRSRRSGSRRAA